MDILVFVPGTTIRKQPLYLVHERFELPGPQVLMLARSVISLSRYGVPDSSSRVVYIAGSARNKMYMAMIDRLPCAGSIVHSNVESVN